MLCYREKPGITDAGYKESVRPRRSPLQMTLWLASGGRAAKKRVVARHFQSRNGKVSREIERKFLLNKLPPNLRHFHRRIIEQGYLAVKNERNQVVLRTGGPP